MFKGKLYISSFLLALCLRKVLNKLNFISPSIYSKMIPEDHFLRKLNACLDWSRLEAAVPPCTVKIMGDLSQTYRGGCSRQNYCSTCMTGGIETSQNMPGILW
jgi:hypothetical protein